MKRTLFWFCSGLFFLVVVGCSSHKPVATSGVGDQVQSGPQSSSQAVLPSDSEADESALAEIAEAKKTYREIVRGKATYYADRFHMARTASGERYSRDLKTAAHRTLPFGTMVRVTNMANGKSVVVKINDRQAYSKTRVIDLSKSAFASIGNLAAGVLSVKLEIVE